MKNTKRKENLKQRAYLNAITTSLDYFAKALVNFLLTPILVGALGAKLYGVWEVLNQFSQYTNMADIRVNQVLKWAIAKDREVLPESELRKYVTATFILSLIILPFILLIAGVLAWYSPTITGVEKSYYSLIRLTSSLLFLGVIVKLFFGVFESILNGMNLGYRRMGFRASIFIAGGLLKIAALKMGYGLVSLALIQLFLAITIGFALYWIVKKNVPWFGLGKFEFVTLKRFFRTSGWFMGWTGTKMLFLNSDKILLGFFLGPIYVAQYAITKYLANTINGVVNNIINSVMPGLGKIYGSKDFTKLRAAREQTMLLSWIFIVSMGVVIIIFNQTFVGLWVESAQYGGIWVNLLIVIMTAQYVFINNDSAIISLTLEIKEKVFLGLATALSSILLGILLMGELGIPGLILGYIIGRAIMSIGYPLILKKKTKSNVKSFKIPFRVILSTIVLWGMALGISITFQINYNWVFLALGSCLTFLITAIISFYLGLNREQRNKQKTSLSQIKLLKGGD